jgi:hypothetical protein
MVEDIPVGGGGGGSFGDEHATIKAVGHPDDDKPMEERLVSKAWAVRKTAFE